MISLCKCIDKIYKEMFLFCMLCHCIFLPRATMVWANLKKISLMENMAALEALQDSSCEL